MQRYLQQIRGREPSLHIPVESSPSCPSSPTGQGPANHRTPGRTSGQTSGRTPGGHPRTPASTHEQRPAHGTPNRAPPPTDTGHLNRPRTDTLMNSQTDAVLTPPDTVLTPPDTVLTPPDTVLTPPDTIGTPGTQPNTPSDGRRTLGRTSGRTGHSGSQRPGYGSGFPASTRFGLDRAKHEVKMGVSSRGRDRVVHRWGAYPCSRARKAGSVSKHGRCFTGRSLPAVQASLRTSPVSPD